MEERGPIELELLKSKRAPFELRLLSFLISLMPFDIPHYEERITSGRVVDSIKVDGQIADGISLILEFLSCQSLQHSR